MEVAYRRLQNLAAVVEVLLLTAATSEGTSWPSSSEKPVPIEMAAAS